MMDTLLNRRANMLKDIETLDQAIESLRVLGYTTTDSGSQPVPVDGHLYVGWPNYKAAVHYMETNHIKDIGLEELTKAIMERGAACGENPKRYSTVLAISIRQNIKMGRTAIVRDVESNIVSSTAAKRRKLGDTAAPN